MNEPTINYSLLGKNIKECRLRRNFTYKDLYKMSHVKEKTLRNIESGNSRISLLNLINISNALNVSIDHLLMDSLENKTTAIQFMLECVFDGLSPAETEVLTETGKLIKTQLLKFDSAD